MTYSEHELEFTFAKNGLIGTLDTDVYTILLHKNICEMETVLLFFH